MLCWMNDYYVGEGIREPGRIKEKIDAGRITFGIYLITLSENPGNLLEIIPAALLLQKSLFELCPKIIGMAKGKEAAMELAVEIVKEIYGSTGAFQVKEYFRNR